MTDSERAELRRLAEAAIPGYPLDRTTGEWEPYFNYHGDPFVALAVGEKGRGGFGHVAFIAQVGTDPKDYGKARAEYIAAACPSRIIALLDALEAATSDAPPTPAADDSGPTPAAPTL